MVLSVWTAALGLATAQFAEPVRLDRVERTIQGWKVSVDRALTEGAGRPLGEEAILVLTAKLHDIATVVPAEPLAKLRKVRIVLDRDYPTLKRMQYHPSADWLRQNGHDPKTLARCVHIPQAADLAGRFAAHQQPWAVLHELAHAYHDQVRGYDDPTIRAAYEAFKASFSPKEALHIAGRPREHYGLTNPMEFFAEMSEAYFGTNDFAPFVRAELKRDLPEAFALMESVWGPIPYPSP
ncbi:MAG: hypothetical protein KIS66_15070 [Fimbriimonadaceae bacterium]|nr:hypothetical protein [Fimbriimonadaceae bacterium]